MISVNGHYADTSIDMLDKMAVREIEEQIKNIDGIEKMATIISAGKFNIILELEKRVDKYNTANKVKDAVSLAKQYLPSDMATTNSLFLIKEAVGIAEKAKLKKEFKALPMGEKAKIKKEHNENRLKKKEIRGIHNIIHNDKQSTQIYKDAELVEDIIKYEKGHHDFYKNKGFGQKHIDRHIGMDKNGWVTIKEIMNIGEAIRNTKPYTKKGNRVYEYFNSDNVRFRVIIGNKKNGERVISFFSNRKAGRGNDSHDYIYNQPLHAEIIPQNKPEVNNDIRRH